MRAKCVEIYVPVHPTSPDLVFAPTGGSLYRSKDGGETWEHLYRCYCRAVWSDPAQTEADSVDRNGRIEGTDDGGETWQPVSKKLEVPWPRHMVQRFLQVGHELQAVLSNGDLLAAPLTTLAWQYIMPGAGWVHAVAAMCV